MKTALCAIAISLSFATVSGVASAKGCLEGAAVGGLAGHVAGRHGVLGAAAGCAIGHHRAKVKAKQEARMQQNPAPSAPTAAYAPKNDKVLRKQ